MNRFQRSLLKKRKILLVLLETGQGLRPWWKIRGVNEFSMTDTEGSGWPFKKGVELYTQ